MDWPSSLRSNVSISWAQIQCFLCRAYYWLGENIKFYEDIQTAEAARCQRVRGDCTKHKRWLTPTSSPVNRCNVWRMIISGIRQMIMISVCLLSILRPLLYRSQGGWPAPVLVPSYFTINLWSSLDVTILAILIKIRSFLRKLYISNQAWLAHFYHSSNGIEYFTFYTVYHIWWK